MIDCGYADLHFGSYMEQLKKDAYKNAVPLTGIFELTPRCNMDCQMCYVHLKPDQIPAIGRELTTAEWIDIARQARDMGMVQLTLTGGEVLVRKDFRELYDALSEMGFLIQIYTNGYALDQETVDWLAQRPPYALRFTLYGFSDETYEKVCHVKNGFTRTIEAMTRVRKAAIPMYMVSTITKDNEMDYPKIAAFAEVNKIPFTYTTNLIHPVRGAQADVEKYQIESQLPDPKTLAELRKPENRKKPRRKVSNLLEVCDNYRRGFWITWNGNMQLCTFLTEPAQSVLTQSFSEAWYNLLEDLQQLHSASECDNCKYSGYCSRCYGEIYTETGRCDAVAKSCCEAARFQYQIYETE